MIIVSWIVRGVFLLMPLILTPIYVLFCGFILPLFFWADGTSEMVKFWTGEFLFEILPVYVVLLIINFFYNRIFNFFANMADNVKGSLVIKIDCFYDKILCGEYGKGCSTKAGMTVRGILYVLCAILGTICAFCIIVYFIEDVPRRGLSWSVWMEGKWSPRVNRWVPLIIFTTLFTRPIVYTIERPVCGFIEKAESIYNSKINKSN